MTWLEGLQKALHYIEKNLEEKLEIEEIARVANVSAFHFQRTFAILTEIPVGEYIRRRRLTIAGQACFTQGKRLLISLLNMDMKHLKLLQKHIAGSMVLRRVKREEELAA